MKWVPLERPATGIKVKSIIFFVVAPETFWASLTSGALYSLLTGIVVGLAMWRVQVGSEARQRRYGYEKELEYLKIKLKACLREPDVLSIDNVVV